MTWYFISWDNSYFFIGTMVLILLILDWQICFAYLLGWANRFSHFSENFALPISELHCSNRKDLISNLLINWHKWKPLCIHPVHCMNSPRIDIDVWCFLESSNFLQLVHCVHALTKSFAVSKFIFSHCGFWEFSPTVRIREKLKLFGDSHMKYRYICCLLLRNYFQFS